MKNFYAEQKLVKRKSGLLLILFSFSVCFLCMSFIILHHAIFFNEVDISLYEGIEINQIISIEDNDLAYYLTLFIIIIFTAVFYKKNQLKKGGYFIAQKLGADLIHTDSHHALERQALDIVEQLALKFNIPVPYVYLLKHQSGVNGFVAGYNTKDAAIVLTRGALEYLNNNELRALITHEFYYIVTGKMQLHSKMISLLYGITFVGQLGEQILLSNLYLKNTKQKENNSFIAQFINGIFGSNLLGAILVFIGWIGVVLADIIKKIICINTIYNADKFVLNLKQDNTDLCDTLKVIEGLKTDNEIKHINIHEYGHLFFTDPQNKWYRLFKAQPTAINRLKNLTLNRHQTHIIKKREKLRCYMAENALKEVNYQSATRMNASQLITPVPLPVLPGIPSHLVNIAHQPKNAAIIIYSLMLSQDWKIKNLQLKYMVKQPHIDIHLLDQTESQLDLIALKYHFILIEIAISALKCLNPQQKLAIYHTINNLNEFDSKFDLLNWSLTELAAYHLNADKPAFKLMSNTQIKHAWLSLISFIALYECEDINLAEKAFLSAAEIAGYKNISFKPFQSPDISTAQKSIDVISRLQLRSKDKILKSLLFCAEYDGQINQSESILLFALSARFELPICEFNL